MIERSNQKIHPEDGLSLRVGGKHEAQGDRNDGLQVPGRTSSSEGQPQSQPSFIGPLVCSRCRGAAVPQTAWLLNNSLFSLSSGGWKVQDPRSSRVWFLVRTLSGLQTASFLVHPHMPFLLVLLLCVYVCGVCISFLLEGH